MGDIVVQELFKTLYLIAFVRLNRKMSDNERNSETDEIPDRRGQDRDGSISRSRSHDDRWEYEDNRSEQRLREDRNRSNRLLTRMVKAIQDARSIQFNEAVVSMRLSELDGLWARHKDTTSALLAFVDLDNAATLAEYDDENIEVATLYHEGSKILYKRLDEIKAARARPKTVKPSEINLPKFGGRYTAWVSWRAQFVSKVKNSQLIAADKIDLLLGALTGEARQCAGETEHRDQRDLDRMWTKLEATYDNKYQIVTEHISKLLDLPVMTTASPDMLRKIVDTVEQELRSLERFDYQTDSWDPLVAVIILRKLDPATIGNWEMDRDPIKPPSLKDVLPFLEKRILAIRNLKVMSQHAAQTISHAASERGSQHSGQQSVRHSGQNKRNPFGSKGAKENDESVKRARFSSNSGAKKDSTGGNPPMCGECKMPHFLWHCKTFKGWTLPRRVEKVAEWGICPCCLIEKHPAADCPSQGCARCNMAKHNNMLCPRHIVFRSNTLSLDNRRHKRAGSK